MTIGDDFNVGDGDALLVTGGDLDQDGIADHLDPLDDRMFDDLPVSEVPSPTGAFPDPATTAVHLPPGYIGEDPADAAEHWHHQEASHSCAVACQEFVLDDITGVDHPEGELTALAEANGWYVPGEGSPPGAIGLVLEAYGIPTEQHHGASAEDLAAALDQGKHVIVGVESSDYMSPGFDPNDPLDQYPGMPGQGADHAIQVIGIDNTDPTNPMVVVNDPGHPDGQGGALPLATFLDAWEGSGNYMVTASGGTR